MGDTKRMYHGRIAISFLRHCDRDMARARTLNATIMVKLIFIIYSSDSRYIEYMKFSCALLLLFD